MVEVRQTEEFAKWLKSLRDAKATAYGGDKSTQARDIKRAKELAADL